MKKIKHFPLLYIECIMISLNDLPLQTVGSRGPITELLQSTLKKSGFFSGQIDGIFGNITKTAVANFQAKSGLIADGIAGISTWRALSPYINGYDIHIVRNGDTLYNLANLYSSTVDGIAAANPGINFYNLQVGQRLVVPHGRIVVTDVSYSSQILNLNLSALKNIYPFIETGYLGRSALCRRLPYIKIGRGKKEVFYNASIHANEWITSPVIMKFLEDYCYAFVNRRRIYGYDAQEIYNKTTIYIAPMLNPDGVDLVTGAFGRQSQAYKNAEQIALDYPAIPFPSGWKANIQGVDLNLQFPANWEQAKQIKFSQGFISPAPRDFVGTAPLSTPEALSVYNFTLSHNFRLMLTYHTQGRVIYWKYLDYLPENSYYIGTRFSDSSGYALEETPYASSFAGYKDWFIQEYNLPGYTIEAGIGENPLSISQFDTIYNENLGILVLGAVLAE